MTESETVSTAYSWAKAVKMALAAALFRTWLTLGVNENLEQSRYVRTAVALDIMNETPASCGTHMKHVNVAESGGQKIMVHSTSRDDDRREWPWP